MKTSLFKKNFAFLSALKEQEKQQQQIIPQQETFNIYEITVQFRKSNYWFNQNVFLHIEFKIKKGYMEEKIAWEWISSAFNRKYDSKCIKAI